LGKKRNYVKIAFPDYTIFPTAFQSFFLKSGGNLNFPFRKKRDTAHEKSGTFGVLKDVYYILYPALDKNTIYRIIAPAQSNHDVI